MDLTCCSSPFCFRVFRAFRSSSPLSRLNAGDRAILLAVANWILALALLAHGDPAAPNAMPPTSLPVAPPAGFVQIAIPAHADAIVSLPFTPVDSSLDAVLAGQLTASTNLASADRVLIWDSATSHYRTAAKFLPPSSPSGSGTGDGSVWFEVSVSSSGVETVLGPVGNDFRIEPGVGFVLRNLQDREQTVHMGGHIVVEAIHSMSVPPGIGIVGFPFTSAKDVSETKWSKSDTLSTNAFQMGAGSWVSSPKAALWTEPRPYPNPFSLSNTPVRIADILLDADKATLDIQVSDPTTVRSFDVLTLDLAPSSLVTDWTCGWRLAAANVRTSGQTELPWTDDLSASAFSFKGVRLYLVLRADSAVDVNGNGIPDRREPFVSGNNVPGIPVRSLAADPSAGSSADATDTVSRAQTTANPVPPIPLPALVPIVYVDIRTGDDRFSGLLPVVAAAFARDGTNAPPAQGDLPPGLTHGPKRTIRSGLNSAGNDGVVVVRDGVYRENVNIVGRPVCVRVDGSVDLRGVAVDEQSMPAAGTTNAPGPRR